MDIKAMAEYMVKEGIENTIECNWIFDIEEIALHFEVSIEDIKKNIDKILIKLDLMEEVAECSYENDDTFYITFYTDFCNKEKQTMIQEEIETCPYCEYENIIQWDVKKDGYKIICQNCGKEIMLCNACYSDDETQTCDWCEEYGCFRN